jgi:hypothetical protein
MSAVQGSSYYSTFMPQTYQHPQQYSQGYPQQAYHKSTADYPQYATPLINTTLASQTDVSQAMQPSSHSEHLNLELTVPIVPQQTSATSRQPVNEQPIEVNQHTATDTAKANLPIDTSQIKVVPANNQPSNSQPVDAPQVNPQPLNMQPQSTNVQSINNQPGPEKDKPMIVVDSPPIELFTSNSNSASEDDVIITGTNKQSEKPLRRSVVLPPRRLVPSSLNQSSVSSDSPKANTSTSTNTMTSSSTPSASTAASTTVVEPMEVEGPSHQPQGDSSRVTPITLELPISFPPSPSSPNRDNNQSDAQVTNSGERSPCMKLSTARFLQQPAASTESNGPNNTNDNTVLQNNNPMYVSVPAADQSELSRLRAGPPRRQIEHSDEYWHYWSTASQSQVSQSAEQDHEGVEQQAEPVPESHVEHQSHEQSRHPGTKARAKSSEFGLTNFELDLPPISPPAQDQVHSSDARSVQPNPTGFSNSDGSNKSTSPPRIIGPIDKYFRTSPDKAPSLPAGQVQQQGAIMQGRHEDDAIMINDSQEDPSTRANNNTNNNVNTQRNIALLPAANNNEVTGRKSPENLRHSHSGSEKPKVVDPVKVQQKVLLPYIPDGPLVLTRIEPTPYWHGGLLWPGLGTIKQQYMELFIPNDPRVQAIPYIQELPKLLMAREMVICDQKTMPNGHYCIQLISPVLDKQALPKAFWDPNYKAFWSLKMHYNNLMLCIGPKMIDRKSILCLYITVQGPVAPQQQPITCTLSTAPGDMLNFFKGLNMEQYFHDFQRNGITSLYALCQITREQMVTIVPNERDIGLVMAELKKLVMTTTTLNKNQK